MAGILRLAATTDPPPLGTLLQHIAAIDPAWLKAVEEFARLHLKKLQQAKSA